VEFSQIEWEPGTMAVFRTAAWRRTNR